jgi:hypothetical protein
MRLGLRREGRDERDCRGKKVWRGRRKRMDGWGVMDEE